jgi:hypothetical protein
MRLVEFLDQRDYETAYYDPSQDEANIRVPNDTRRPKLFLRHLNRLKRVRALNKLEGLKREDLLGIMYSAPEEPPMGGGPPGF